MVENLWDMPDRVGGIRCPQDEIIILSTIIIRAHPANMIKYPSIDNRQVSDVIVSLQQLLIVIRLSDRAMKMLASHVNFVFIGIDQIWIGTCNHLSQPLQALGVEKIVMI